MVSMTDLLRNRILSYNGMSLFFILHGDNIFYKVRDANHIILIDSFGNEPQKEDKKNYILKRKVRIFYK